MTTINNITIKTKSSTLKFPPLSQCNWHVGVSSAKMPSSCKYNTTNYKNVVVYLGRRWPSMLSERSVDVVTVAHSRERLYIGSERGQGYDYLNDCHNDVIELNKQLAKYKANPQLKWTMRGTHRIHKIAGFTLCKIMKIELKSVSYYQVYWAGKNIGCYETLREARAEVASIWSEFVCDFGLIFPELFDGGDQ